MKLKIQSFITLGALFALILIAVSSCDESFLEPEPLDFYAPENVLNTEAGLQAVLDRALASMRTEITDDQSPFMTNLKYSDVGVDGTTDKSYPWQDLNKQMLPDGQNYHNAYTKIGWYWDESYKEIKNCNTVITRIDDAEFSSENKKNILLGGAYFLRAYRYYMKTLQYGDVPLVLEELSEPKVDFYTTTKESIWKKMIKDLEFAVQHVPEANKVANGQVTKAACKHLLAKYYLLEGRFDDAINQTNDIINGGVHSLVTQRFGIDQEWEEKDVIWDMHRAENRSVSENTEGLWMLIDRYGIEGGTSRMGFMRSYGPWFGGTGIIKTPDGENGMNDSPGLEIPLVETYGRGVARVHPTGYTQRDMWVYNGEMDWQDYRHRKGNGTKNGLPFPNWMTMEQLVYNNSSLKGTSDWYGKNVRMYDEDGTLLVLDTIRNWFQWPFYKFYVEDPDRPQPQGGPGDWYIFRLAETYLLRAEAYVWKQEWQKAADDINIIRQRANAKYMYTAADIQQEGIGSVLDERNRELYAEEPRKVELTRMAITFARTGIPCYNGKTYSMDNISQDNFWYDRVDEISDLYNKGVRTPYGNLFTCSPFHIFWPVPSYAINANPGGVINQNEGYPGTGRNVPPLVYGED